MSGCSIVYRNLALVDKRTETTPTSTNIKSFADALSIRQEITPPFFGTFEKNAINVDTPVPFFKQGVQAGYISNSLSDELGVFSTPRPSLNIALSKAGSSGGITLHFSPIEQEFPTEIVLTWTVQGGQTVSERFFPNQNSYFCQKTVENYTNVKVEFVKWNLAYHWAKLYGFDLGQEQIFVDNSLFSVGLNECGNLIADEIQLNTSNITLVSKEPELFQKKQEYEIWHDDEFMGSHYVRNVKREHQKYVIEGTDILGKLDNIQIQESIVNQNISKTLEACIRDYIMVGLNENEFKVEWDVSAAALKSKTVKGKFPQQISRRTALTMLCIATGAYVDTSRSNAIVIKSSDYALSQTIPLAEIPETQVFVGDTYEMKEAYRQLTIKYTDTAGVAQEVSRVNPTDPESTARKEFALNLWSEPVSGIADIMAKYYFGSDFYNAKAVVGYEQVNDLIEINGVKGTIEDRKMVLDGEKVISTSKYKVVV